MGKTEKIIRSHRARVAHAKKLINDDPLYAGERISIIDREAFVEFLLLEDIVKLYQARLIAQKAYKPTGRADEKGQKTNIEKFSAIINVFNAAIGAARACLTSGNYTTVWKAIHEGALMAAANSVKRLPELRTMAIELLRDLSDEALKAEGEAKAVDDALDDLESHEENVRRVKDLPTQEEIDEIIRIAEAAIPDKKNSGRIINLNT